MCSLLIVKAHVIPVEIGGTRVWTDCLNPPAPDFIYESLGLFPTNACKLILSLFLHVPPYSAWPVASPQSCTSKFQVCLADLPPLSSSQSSHLSCSAIGHRLFIKPVRSDGEECLQTAMLHKNNSTKVPAGLGSLLVQKSTCE